MRVMLIAVALPGAVRAAPDRPVAFCVLVPHFKDEYWLSVAYGLEGAAATQGVELQFFEAGGYRALPQQIAQLHDCAARKVAAILIGAVSADDPALLRAVGDASRSVPVFGLVNRLVSDDLSGSVGVDWRGMGTALGQLLARRHPAGSAEVEAVLVSGPEGSGWIGPLEGGLRHSLGGSGVRLVEVMGADTGLRQQLAAVEDALARYPRLDYLIGSAPAIEAAVGLLDHAAPEHRPVLLASYISHTVKRGLLNGSILAVPFDDPVRQGAMAVGQAMAVLASGERTGVVGPPVVLVTRADAQAGRIRLSPADYFPAIR